MTSHQRSSTGRHELLPASNARGENALVPIVPMQTVASWTFGRGTVIRTIWPAVLLHTVFAALVTTVSLLTPLHLGVPQVLITVLGVVIGFVIAYRASSGYDRYWMGRCCWSDLIRTCRTMGRLVWFHIPLRLEKDRSVTEESVLRVMREKRLALELLEGFVVALKHHLRGEMGIYYEDLYHLVRPLHDHHATKNGQASSYAELSFAASGAQFGTKDTQMSPPVTSPTSTLQRPAVEITVSNDPIIPPLDSYGTFWSSEQPSTSSVRQRGRIERRSSSSGCSSCSEMSDSRNHENHPFLFPSTTVSFSSPISTELIPFSAAVTAIAKLFRRKKIYERLPVDVENTQGLSNSHLRFEESAVSGSRKKRPKVAGGGENLPLEILRCPSEWVCVLDERGVVPGNPLGGLYGCLAAFEDSLSALERILTTPLPFVYSTQIRQCVWTYLFLLPFQMVDQFGWFTIPGVAVAAFFYIGFLAAGEEIEQPFGYDENDLDLDLFCREIVHVDIQNLLRTPCPNVVLSIKHERHSAAHQGGSSLERTASSDPVRSSSKSKNGLQTVFGNIP